MKLLFVIPTLGQGGAQRALVTLANSFLKKPYKKKLIDACIQSNLTSNNHENESNGIDIAIATFASASVIPRHIPDQGVRVHQLGAISGSRASLFGVAGTIRKLRGLIVDMQPHVIISFQDIANFPAAMACIGLDVKLIVSERQDTRFYRLPFIRKLLRRVMYPLADKVVVQTSLVKDQMSAVFQDSTVVIPNAIEVPANQAEPHKAASIYRILGVGRLEAQKNFSLLISAAALALEGRDDWRLTIYGDGSLRADLEKQICDLKLDGKVELPGITDDIFSVMANSHMFVLSSRYEGFPNVLGEAAAAGLPCIAFSDVSGTNELIEHEQSGLLITSGDCPTKVLAAAIRQLIDNSTTRKDMGAKSVEVARRYSPDRISTAWADLVLSVLD